MTDDNIPITNIFARIPSDLPEELVETLLDAKGIRVERIVSHGNASPPGFWYDQEENEWACVLAGEARLAFDDGRTVTLGPGDWIDLPAHARHRTEWTAPDRDTIWLAVFY